MKKSLITLLALVLSCLMIFTACGDKGEDKEENKEEETTVSTQDTTAAPDVDTPTEKTDEEKVADYVALKETSIISLFESALSGTGLTCNSTIKAEGTGIVVTICINELVDIPEEQKSMVQSAFDQNISSLSANFAPIHAEIPELTYVKFNYCEKDGDLIATFTIDGSTVDAPNEIPGDIVNEDAQVTYATISEDNQILEGVTFFYDSNNIVTKVSFEMVSNPDEVLSQENLDGFEQAYSGFEQFKGLGYNLTADYGVVDGIHTLEIIITLSGENEIDLFAQLLGFFPTEDYVTLAEAEDAAISAGYALFNPEA